MDWGAAGACLTRPALPWARQALSSAGPALQAAAASPPVETGAHPVAGKEVVRGVAPENV